jgi:Protein of unknown function (DUF1493)
MGNELSSLAMSDLASEIVDFVAWERGLPPAKVGLLVGLQDDLGLDGDDAVWFFEEFGKRYFVDLDPLYRNWSRHFVPEGFGSPWFLIAAGVFVATVGLSRFGILPTWTPGFSVVGVGFFWAWSAYRKQPVIRITVADLIDAATKQRWPIAYPDAEAQ